MIQQAHCWVCFPEKLSHRPMGRQYGTAWGSSAWQAAHIMNGEWVETTQSMYTTRQQQTNHRIDLNTVPS